MDCHNSQTIDHRASSVGHCLAPTRRRPMDLQAVRRERGSRSTAARGSDACLRRPIPPFEQQTTGKAEFAMTENDKRTLPRHRVLKGAFIALSERAPKLQCSVRNWSEKGAGLRVSTTFGLPQHFDLIVDGLHRRCRVQWRTDTTIGAIFES